jgi:hypothetical protein
MLVSCDATKIKCTAMLKNKNVFDYITMFITEGLRFDLPHFLALFLICNNNMVIESGA